MVLDIIIATYKFLYSIFFIRLPLLWAVIKVQLNNKILYM
ncbi:hypothetical protein DSUL_160012 [Desulfovibrionales bacterium]